MMFTRLDSSPESRPVDAHMNQQDAHHNPCIGYEYVLDSKSSYSQRYELVKTIQFIFIISTTCRLAPTHPLLLNNIALGIYVYSDD